MSTTPHVLLAIDPGVESGLALFLDGVLRYAESVRSDYPTDVVTKNLAIRRALGFLPGVKPEYRLTYATEDQFLQGCSPNRFKSVAQLIRNSTCWETLLRIQGWDIANKAWPSTWQSFWHIKGKSDQRKQLSRNLVCNMYARPRPIAGKLTDNISDAILIGLHHLATQEDTPRPVQTLATTYGRS